MFRFILVATLLSTAVFPVPALAGEQADASVVRAASLEWGGKLQSQPAAAWGLTAADPIARPAALPALYVSLAALQAYDVYSTRKAIALGAREANPLMQGVVTNPSAFWALKAGTTIATVTAAERLWKTNRTAAIAVMLASNGVAAVVAARNARTLQRQR